MELDTFYRNYEVKRNLRMRNLKIIGYYSLATDGIYKDDYSELKYIKNDNVTHRNVNMDLNNSIEKRKKKNKAEGLGHFLHYLKLNRNVLDVFSKNPVTMDEVPFVTHRGCLVAISKLPHDTQQPLRLNINLVNGVIYMWIESTPQEKEEKKRFEASEKDQRGVAWGFKFEQCIASDEPYGDPDLFSPVDESREFNCIFKSSIGKHNLIYRGEVDGILLDDNNNNNNKCDKGKPEDFLKYLNDQTQVEIKTAAAIDNYPFKRFKSLSWWIQSYFGGVDLLVCGLRNKDGIVSEIVPFNPSILPVKSNGWSPDTCMNFCDEYLKFIKKVLTSKLKSQGFPVGGTTNIRSYPVTNIILHRDPKKSVYVYTPSPGEDIGCLDQHFVEMIYKK